MIFERSKGWWVREDQPPPNSLQSWRGFTRSHHLSKGDLLSPFPWGEGGLPPALLRAGAGRVRGLSSGIRLTAGWRIVFTTSFA
jgi:hypothetical protein